MQNQKSFFSKREEELQKYWEDNKIFEKSIEQRDENNSYVFYDGPPFATGLPHYGHIVGTIMKDVVPRYWTMKGKRVERKWGWDCHGLPVENIVEKELNVKSKKEIEDMGVEKFNELCRSKVLSYVDEWKKIIPRIGRWADMDNSYKTMDKDYMESIWWVFKELWDKDLIYKNYKSMHVCPRCETTLSQQEVAEGYKDIKDISVTAKFELDDELGTFILAWTTTPWTLPGNVALAVGADLNYVKVECAGEKYILVKDLLEKVFNEKEYSIVKEFKGKELEGKKYKPLFDYFVDKDLPNKENLYTVQTADFVSTEDGTGVVHIAPAFGEDDMILGKEKNLSFIQHVGMNGHFTDDVKDFAGENVKPIEDCQATDVKILKYLSQKGLIFSKEKYKHSYPHCWRCDTPLINYATSSWFVNVLKVKDKALETAKNINWQPAHIKNGRFGNWLEGARDWSISRQRFWASVMPVWYCEKCDVYKVYGSVADLEKDSKQQIDDLHKHVIDKITVPCEKCGEQIHRIPDVLDTWFDSGSMPYAQMHYPFENKEKFEKNFPAGFIAEGVDQTRAWFYYLHILSNALKNTHAFENVIVNGTVLAEDGKKMSKRLQNYPDPMLIVEKYCADAMRYYLISTGVMKAQDLCFSEKGVDEVFKKIILITTNVLNLFDMYRSQLTQEIPEAPESYDILDKWMIAKTYELIKELTEKLDNYDLTRSALLIGDFINELSTWYVRRSRDRIKAGGQETQESLLTLSWVLKQLSLVMAPFMPFLAEHVWQKLGMNESVHLQNWPTFHEEKIDQVLLNDMKRVRQIVEVSLAARDEAKVKVRQPLSKLLYKTKKLETLLEEIIAQEINVKTVEHSDEIRMLANQIVKEDAEIKVALDLEMTDELKAEGNLRELIRNVNNLRKNAGLTINDHVTLYWQSSSADLQLIFSNKNLLEELKKSVLAKDVVNDSKEVDKKLSKEMNINDENILIALEK